MKSAGLVYSSQSCRKSIWIQCRHVKITCTCFIMLLLLTAVKCNTTYLDKLNHFRGSVYWVVWLTVYELLMLWFVVLHSIEWITRSLQFCNYVLALNDIGNAFYSILLLKYFFKLYLLHWPLEVICYLCSVIQWYVNIRVSLI